MGKMALGYGSEWHMLRYLGRYRSVLDTEVRAATGASDVRWLDWNSTPSDVDTEWKGISFLPEEVRGAIADEWARWWPQRGNPHNWDAVALLDGREWLLVEAKAHLGEVATSCTAVPGDGRDKIVRACAATRDALGAQGADWLTGFYQMAQPHRLPPLPTVSTSSGTTPVCLLRRRPAGSRCHRTADRGRVASGARDPGQAPRASDKASAARSCAQDLPRSPPARAFGARTMNINWAGPFPVQEYLAAAIDRTAAWKRQWPRERDDVYRVSPPRCPSH